MSGGTLPRTGMGAFTLAVGGVSYSAPLPVALAVGGALTVLAGAVLVRLAWRRQRPVGVQ